MAVQWGWNLEPSPSRPVQLARAMQGLPPGLCRGGGRPGACLGNTRTRVNNQIEHHGSTGYRFIKENAATSSFQQLLCSLRLGSVNGAEGRAPSGATWRRAQQSTATASGSSQ